MLLLALGVDHDTVLDDYEATSLYRFPEDQHDSLANMLRAGISPEAAAGVLGTPRWAMAEAVDLLLGFPDGIEGFLTGPAGVEPGELAALHESTSLPHPRPPETMRSAARRAQLTARCAATRVR